MAMVSSADALLTQIRADRQMPERPFRSLWDARELLYLLTKREIRLRYQHSIVGIGWAILQPLVTLLVLTMFQLIMGRHSSGPVPYPLYAVIGLIPWNFLSHALTQSSYSVLNYYSLIQKVCFPRLALPLAAVLSATADFVVGFPLVPILMVNYGFPVRRTVLLLPLFTLEIILLAAGLGIFLAAVNTRFRDAANALPLVMQLWFFLTPIIFSSDMIPAKWQLIAGLNPMLGILEGFRWCLFGTAQPMLGYWIAFSWFITIAMLLIGLLTFLRGEEMLAELA
jgi:lipopolysaccharide transport system permease protein